MDVNVLSSQCLGQVLGRVSAAPNNRGGLLSPFHAMRTADGDHDPDSMTST